MTMMLGGVIGGYCASGRLRAATAPARVMTIDSTAAKIGRLMKKCENMNPCPLPASPVACRFPNPFGSEVGVYPPVVFHPPPGGRSYVSCLPVELGGLGGGCSVG